jgi:class 3 adenylate cyclase
MAEEENNITRMINPDVARKRESMVSKHPNEIKEVPEEDLASNMSIKYRIESETASKGPPGQDSHNEKSFSKEHVSHHLNTTGEKPFFRKTASSDLILERKKTLTLKKAKSQLFVENSRKNDEKLDRFKNTLKSILDSYIELFTMAFFTCFVLFGPDLKAISLDPQYDEYFNIIYLIVLILFCLEFSASWFVRPGYIWTFFFWLDLLAISSMFFEIDWFLQPIVDSLILKLSIKNYATDQKDYLLNSIRDNKISTLMKFIRVIRLVRIVKLYKAAIYIQRNIDKKKKLELMRKRNQKRLEKLKEREKMLERFDRMEGGGMGGTKSRTVRSNSLKRVSRKDIGQYDRKGSNDLYNNTSYVKHNSHSKVNDVYERDGSREIKTDIRDIITAIRPDFTPYLGGGIDKEPKHAISEFNPDTTVKPEIKPIEGQHTILSNPPVNNKEVIDYETLPNESNISRTVSDSITKKVIIIILMMLFISPLVDEDVYANDSYFSYLAICQMSNTYMADYNDVDGVKEFLDFTISHYEFTDSTPPIIDIVFQNNITLYNNTLYSNKTYRIDEQAYSYYLGGSTVVKYSIKHLSVLISKINIVRTFFAIACLYYMAYVLEQDSTKLVLEPLQVMINVVEEVASDPVNATNLEMLQKKIKKSMKTVTSKDKPMTMNFESSTYEIKVIQLAILRISSLLAIGFGEAGGEILKENLGSTQELNPMLPGKKKNAIFGFCDIRGFPDINVALQEKTMVFVNEIAEIVHSSVDMFGGAANKNIGDAFLVVWKLDQEEDKSKAYTEINYSNHHIQSMANKALLGFLHVIKRINKNHKLRSYKNYAEIQSSNHIEQPFKVSMGFGLHIGWAIEGPIGSMYKMDCSYLSPNVNLAARLEGATRQYGVSILLSGELYSCLSDDLKAICRKIDIVKVKGSNKPLELYTVHVNLKKTKRGREKRAMNMTEKRKFYSKKKSDIMSIFDLPGVILEKRGFKELLLDKRGNVFHQKFEKGFNHYIKGEWEQAYTEFSFANFLDRSDGPTRVLLKFIIENGKKAPDDWEGVHVLTSK